MGRRPEQTFFQGRHTGGQEASEKMLSIANLQRTTNQNHNKISPHPCQYDYYLKKKTTQKQKTEI